MLNKFLPNFTVHFDVLHHLEKNLVIFSLHLSDEHISMIEQSKR